MAFAQETAAAKLAPTGLTKKDSDGYFYTEHGAIREYQGEGSPDGVVTAPIGSRCTDIENGKLYINTDGSTAWTAQA